MAMSLPWQYFSLSNRYKSPISTSIRCRNPVVIQAFGRNDFDGFTKRITSGEALRNVWRSANEGLEQFLYEAKKAAERFDRRFQVSLLMDSFAQSAVDRARQIDREFSISRRWRTFTIDFGRNWPRYREELNGFLETPLGKGASMIFFLWFALSGWLFKLFFLATWVLPFAAPLIMGTITKNLVIEGVCPACRTRFKGFKNQVVRCRSCRNVVWQPGRNYSTGSRPASASGPDIIDIEIEEK